MDVGAGQKALALLQLRQRRKELISVERGDQLHQFAIEKGYRLVQQGGFLLRAGDRDAQILVIRYSGSRFGDGLVEVPFHLCVGQRLSVYAVNIRRLRIDGKQLNGPRTVPADFLQQVFGWDPLQTEWDGILCQVEAPTEISVEKFRLPFCLKWRSESEEALTKRARGITSLWADAVKQLPDGEIGFVYIAYPEGARPAIADARTRHILSSMEQTWHRWSVRVPATIINRLYPRPVGSGCPDLIESSLGGAGKGQEFWLSKLPWLVFTRQFE